MWNSVEIFCLKTLTSRVHTGRMCAFYKCLSRLSGVVKSTGEGYLSEQILFILQDPNVSSSIKRSLYSLSKVCYLSRVIPCTVSSWIHPTIASFFFLICVRVNRGQRLYPSSISILPTLNIIYIRGQGYSFIGKLF